MRTAIGLAIVGLGAARLAQEAQTPTFRVAVDAVRIDAVVTDKDGNIVRDLTADEFEVLQDGKKQKVTFAQFVPILTAAAAAPAVPAGPLKSHPVYGAPTLPAAGAVRREHIQRTIALVVDDLSLSVESLYSVKRGLHEFIDRAVQPGDLVALVRTGGSLDGLQPFTTDARVLHAAVDNLKWNAFSRSGVESFPAVNRWMTFDSHATFSPDDFTALDAFRGTTRAAGTLGALNLVVQGAKNLPGRKAVLFVSEGFVVLERQGRTSSRGVDNPGGVEMRSPDPRVRGPLDRVIDQATRAGVVIYSVDARGLQTGGLAAADNLKSPSATEDPNSLGVLTESVRKELGQRGDSLRDTQEGMTYLAEQTGGFAVLNTNNLGAGLTRAAADVRDYYVLGYAPEADTFAAKGKTPQYHKITVRVKRPGLKVRTRKEFYGVSDADESAAPETPAQQLVNAAVSPFTATDIAVRLTTLPGFSPSRGLFVRALLHIDASALKFVKDEDGKVAASADVLGMVFDRDGTEIAHLSTAFSAALTSQAADDALRDGIAYTLRIPIPRPGPYQVRFAVRDRQSGRFGTAGEFIELPDIAHGTFALSGIVLRSDDDISPSAADADRVMISPSQAVRVYKPGARLKYACEIYNAAEPVQLTISVWRGTQKVLGAEPNTLTPPPGQSLWFSAGGAFKLGDALAPGHYVLQVAAQTADAAKKGRVNVAAQVMDFEVR
jgi:VWFA-related protein